MLSACCHQGTKEKGIAQGMGAVIHPSSPLFVSRDPRWARPQTAMPFGERDGRLCGSAFERSIDLTGPRLIGRLSRRRPTNPLRVPGSLATGTNDAISRPTDRRGLLSLKPSGEGPTGRDAAVTRRRQRQGGGSGLRSILRRDVVSETGRGSIHVLQLDRPDLRPEPEA